MLETGVHGGCIKGWAVSLATYFWLRRVEAWETLHGKDQTRGAAERDRILVESGMSI